MKWYLTTYQGPAANTLVVRNRGKKGQPTFQLAWVKFKKMWEMHIWVPALQAWVMADDSHTEQAVKEMFGLVRP